MRWGGMDGFRGGGRGGIADRGERMERVGRGQVGCTGGRSVRVCRWGGWMGGQGWIAGCAAVNGHGDGSMRSMQNTLAAAILLRSYPYFSLVIRQAEFRPSPLTAAGSWWRAGAPRGA